MAGGLMQSEPQYRRMSSEELMRFTAIHEAGHAVAHIRAEEALGLDYPSFHRAFIRRDFSMPYIDDRLRERECVGMVEGPDLYHVSIGLKTFSDMPEWRETILAKMEWAIRLALAGPFAEAASHGVRSKAEMQWYALFNCGASDDYDRAEAVLDDYRIAKGRKNYSLARFADQTRTLVLENCRAIEAVALALLDFEDLDYDAVRHIVAGTF
jgi:hypothetical protein